MAQESFQEKTEEPTPKRLQKAREEGNVAKSAEFNSVFILFFGLLTLYVLSGTILNHLTSFFKRIFRQGGNFVIHTDSVQTLFAESLNTAVTLLTPLMLVTIVIGVGINLAQFGFLFTTKTLQPKASRLDPVAGFKKLFSLKSFVELIKNIVKVLIVALIAYWTISSQKDEYILLMHENVAGIMKFIYGSAFGLALYASGALLALAFLDFLYQKWQYRKDMRMSKQEIKDEIKDAEGDPLIKSTIRSLQRERSRQRMMDAVPEADVVVTNPTHLAVALEYDPEKMAAPKVLAMGARLIAQKIKEIARDHDIPIYENKPLAQSLYKSCKVDQQIPLELFHAVAEVFAYVYQLKHKKAGA